MSIIFSELPARLDHLSKDRYLYHVAYTLLIVKVGMTKELTENIYIPSQEQLNLNELSNITSKMIQEIKETDYDNYDVVQLVGVTIINAYDTKKQTERDF